MQLRKLNDVVNVAANSTATLRIPTGPTYDAVLLRASAASGAALATLTDIRLMLNGRLTQEFQDAVQLDDVNKYHGRDAIGGTGASATPFDILVPFRRPEVQAAGKASTIDAERATSLRTGNLSTVALEMSIGAWTTPKIEAFGVIAPLPSQPVGLLTKTRRFTYNPAGGGDFVMADWPRGPRIIAAHFIKSDVDELTIKRNSRADWDTVSKGAIQDIQDHEGRVPVAGITVADFCVNGNLDEALRTAGLNSLEVTANLATGGALDVVVEYLDTFDGL